MASEFRVGEERLAFDPTTIEQDAGIVFIGRIRSPWQSRAECPKNLAQARERGGGGSVEIAEPYRRGLLGLSRASHVVLISWLGQASRDLIVQKPRHAEKPSGTFALRSPARPNPLGLHVCALTGVAIETGIVGIDAIDVLDGTPLVDLKPYFASIDSFPDATRVDS
jgi:tRNA (adenine37-N6)-methyltransferase